MTGWRVKDESIPHDTTHGTAFKTARGGASGVNGAAYMAGSPMECLGRVIPVILDLGVLDGHPTTLRALRLP